MFDIVTPIIDKYAAKHTSPAEDYLQQLERETHVKVLMGRMVSGHFQGEFLKHVSYMLHPKNVLEIGTYTGYSAICLAAGLQQGGQIHTIDINEELETIQNKYFEKAGLSHCIKRYVGHALDIIPTLDLVFDLVFLDADKLNYHKYYPLIMERLAPSGYLLADNILWNGKVVNQPMDKDTEAIHNFNQMVQQDPNVSNLLLPFRDGMMLIRKNEA